MNDIPKPTLLSRIASRLTKSLGEPHYTYKFKLPLPCCDWCRSRDEISGRQRLELDRRIAVMEGQVAPLRESSRSDELGESFDLKLETALKIFDHAMNAFLKQEYVITDPTNIMRAFSAAFEAVEKLTSTHAVRRYPIDEEMALEEAMRSAVVARSSLRQNGQKLFVPPSLD